MSGVVEDEALAAFQANNWLLPPYGSTSMPTANGFSNSPANNVANSPNNTVAAKLGLPEQVFGVKTTTVLIAAVVALVALYALTGDKRNG